LSFMLNYLNQYMVYVLLALLVLNLLLLIWIYKIRRSLRKIFHGRSMDLERVLSELRDHQQISHKSYDTLEKKVKTLEDAMPQNIRRVGLVRYNPFSDAGGDQSFALALLDEQKNGVIISSLYGREVNRMYAKPIEQGNSKYQLTGEEKKAIEEAFV